MEQRREFFRKLGRLAAAGVLGGPACARVQVPAPGARGGGGAAAGVGPAGEAGPGAVAVARARDRWGELLPQRLLGRTGEAVTMLGLGGWHVGKAESDAEAQALIEAAIAGGVRFFDTAYIYQGGASERRMGKLLTPKYRDDIYLMTKTMAKDAKTAREDLEESLRRLNTDRLDLWQIHSVNNVRDVDARLEAGVLDVLAEAKRSGKVRHIGFTGHRMPAAHLRILERAGDLMDTCQLPVNVVDPGYESFVEQVVPRLAERNIAILAMKTLANAGFFGGKDAVNGPKPHIVGDAVTMEEAIHYVWSFPVAVLITGPNDVAQLEEKIALARSFRALDEERRARLVAQAHGTAPDGLEFRRKVEFYKFW